MHVYKIEAYRKDTQKLECIREFPKPYRNRDDAEAIAFLRKEINTEEYKVYLSVFCVSKGGWRIKAEYLIDGDRHQMTKQYH